jgi:hypothetical protein
MSVSRDLYVKFILIALLFAITLISCIIHLQN